jgi:hypothetical protein
VAQLYATRAVNIWLKFPGDTQPQFLGHGTTAPVPIITPSYVPFFPDIGGPNVPTELLECGESARVEVDLTRYNWNVLMAARSRARNARFPAIRPGFTDAGQGGVAVIRGGCATVLYLEYPGANLPAFQDFVSGNLPDGFRFFAAMLDPETHKPGSTDAYKVRLNWWDLRAYRRDATSQFGRGTMTLFDHDLSELDGLRPNCTDRTERGYTPCRTRRASWGLP